LRVNRLGIRFRVAAALAEAAVLLRAATVEATEALRCD
jgi:hypothetical protein